MKIEHADPGRVLAGGFLAALLAAPGLMMPAAHTEPPAAVAGATPDTPNLSGARPSGQPGAAQDPAVNAPPGQPAGPAADPSEDIRDIRGAKFIWSAWLIAALLAAGVLLALVVFGIWRWHKRRQRPRILSPFERALENLEATRPLMQPATAREFSTAASDIVRRYIEARFDVTATHRTTEEFLHDLLESRQVSLARHRGLLSEFLNQCDLVKFAGISLSAQTMETLYERARAFILETAQPDALPEVTP